MHWGREEEWRTDLPQKTEDETPTGKAQKLLFPCQKSVEKGRVRVQTRKTQGLMCDNIRGKGGKQWGWMGAKGGQ